MERLAVLALLFLLMGCGSGDSDTDATSASGTAEIVKEPLSAPPDLVIERIDEAPIGSVAGVVRLASGAVLVADRQGKRLGLFDSRGAPIRSAGGQGSGPGEFADIYSLRDYRGDSTIVWDIATNRAAIYDSDLNLGRVLVPSGGATAGLLVPLGNLHDGSVVVIHGMPQIGEIEGQAWEQMSVSRLSADGEGMQFLFTLDTKMCPRVEMQFCPYPELGYVSFVDAAGNVLAIADARDSSLEIRNVVTGHVSTFPLPPEGRALSAQEREPYDPDGEDEHLPVPSNMPPFLDLVVGSDGTAWLKTDVDNSWTSYRGDAEAGVRLSLPDGFNPKHFTQHHVTGIHRDDLGVETVRSYPLPGD